MLRAIAQNKCTGKGVALLVDQISDLGLIILNQNNDLKDFLVVSKQKFAILKNPELKFLIPPGPGQCEPIESGMEKNMQEKVLPTDCNHHVQLWQCHNPSRHSSIHPFVSSERVNIW